MKTGSCASCVKNGLMRNAPIDSPHRRVINVISVVTKTDHKLKLLICD